MATDEQQRKANLRLALILASVAALFASASWPRSCCSAAERDSHGALTAGSPLRGDNRRMLGKLLVVAVLMFGFGYALVPMYRASARRWASTCCRWPSSAAATAAAGRSGQHARSTLTRTITVEFDANARGPWDFKPAMRVGAGAPGRADHGDVRVPQHAEPHHGRAGHSRATRRMQASAHFNKLECFCFNEYTLKPGESQAVAGGLRHRPQAAART